MLHGTWNSRARVAKTEDAPRRHTEGSKNPWSEVTKSRCPEASTKRVASPYPDPPTDPRPRL